MRASMRRTLQALPGGERLLRTYRGLRRLMRTYCSLHRLVRTYRGLRELVWRHPLSHRLYVGWMWDEIGRVQFDFMVDQGLKPQDILVDVGCGGLRGGRFFIAYLDPECYLGIDHNKWLIKAGLEHEVPKRLRKEKRPQFVISDRFEFHKFGKRPNYGLAQSLFSHLTRDDILLCLANLRSEIREGGRFYATFVPKGLLPDDYVNPEHSDDLHAFQYDADEILALGRQTGWEAKYIGDWGHPRGQEMLEFLAE
jgi:hypothetical protein